jgi:type III pantothenate kinase
MELIIDIGNSNTVVGVTGDSGWAKVWRMSTQGSEFGAEWAIAISAFARRDGIELSRVKRVVICSVVPVATMALLDFAQTWLHRPALVINSGLELGIQLGMEHPEQLGVDRIANAVEANQMMNGPSIVVDLGTATKVEAISARGVFIGGAIAPGVQLMLDALTTRAARLFSVPLQLPEAAIGRNTTEAMQSGIVLGHLKMVEGLVAEIAESLEGGEPEIIVTGGHAEAEDSPFRLLGRHEPLLTLNGIRRIGELNR